MKRRDIITVILDTETSPFVCNGEFIKRDDNYIYMKNSLADNKETLIPHERVKSIQINKKFDEADTPPKWPKREDRLKW